MGVSHCGAGCALGDIPPGSCYSRSGSRSSAGALLSEFIGDHAAALALGILFLYFDDRLRGRPQPSRGQRRGAEAGVLWPTAFEVGLFGWMALTALVFFPAHRPHPDRPL